MENRWRKEGSKFGDFHYKSFVSEWESPTSRLLEQTLGFTSKLGFGSLCLILLQTFFFSSKTVYDFNEQQLLTLQQKPA